MKKGIHSNTIGMGMNGDILAASRGQQSCGDGTLTERCACI